MVNKRILVTGGAGSIGSEVVRQLSEANKIFILDIDETRAFLLREELKGKGRWVHSRTGDVRNRDTLFDVFSDFKPEIVIHCAALKHVTPCEEYPEEAVETNIIGTLNVIREASRWECFEKFVFISTDKVVNAKGIMGITKLAAESITRNRGKKFVAVRFGNVMNSRGSVLEIWKDQKEKGEPLTITHPEAERYLMTIPDAVKLIIKAAEEGKNGELMVLDMGERIKVKDLKERLYGDYPVKEVGLRQGEVMVERLMTEEEEKLAVKKEGVWVI